MRVITKDITIGNDRYQLVKMSAQTASWISNLLVANSLLNARPSTSNESSEPSEEMPEMKPEEKAYAAVGSLWLLCGASLAEDVYKRIQNCCLMACRQYDSNGTLLAVLMQDGRFVSKDLENDAPTVNRLIMEAMQFNIAPFFIESASPEANPKT